MGISVGGNEIQSGSSGETDAEQAKRIEEEERYRGYVTSLESAAEQRRWDDVERELEALRVALEARSNVHIWAGQKGLQGLLNVIDALRSKQSITAPTSQSIRRPRVELRTDSTSSESVVLIDQAEEGPRGRSGAPSAEAPNAITSEPIQLADTASEPLQIPQVMLMRVLDLTLKILGRALKLAACRRHFEAIGGWTRLRDAMTEINESDTSDSELPSLHLVGLLFSLALNGDRSVVDLFTHDNDALDTYPASLSISPSLSLTLASVLPIVFDLLPFPYRAARLSVVGQSNINPGWDQHQLAMTPRQEHIERIVWRLMIVVVSSSWINLFRVHQALPGIVESVLERLQPSATEAEQETSSTLARSRNESVDFGADFRTDAEEEVARSAMTTAAGPELRPILLRLLRRLVEAGIPSECSHRLFRMLRKHDQPIKSSTLPPPSVDAAGSPTTSSRRRPPRGPRLALKLDMLDSPPAGHLDTEILDVVKHGMAKRWPDVFCFDPASEQGERPGSFTCSDLARTWPGASKGYYFTSWIYIDQLCYPITLLHLHERDRTLLRIRILPNSQVGITSSASPDAEGTEQIFQQAEALVPHQRWVHIAVGGRKASQPANAVPEVKLVINGKRVGAIKCGYPRPTINEPLRATIGADGRDVKEEEGMDFAGLEASTWYLGPTTLLGEYILDDLALLLHHMGPRYVGHLQEPLGRFLTYEGATALNIYLSNLATTSKNNGRKAALPSNSYLVKAIKDGKVIPEDSILFSFTAANVSHGLALNGAYPVAHKSLDLPQTCAHLAGQILAFQPICLDQAIMAASGPLLGLKLVEMSSTASELASAVSILWETLKESWSASEEMERMHGFDILAGLLRTKLPDMMSEQVFKILFSALGINVERPETATIFNSAAYRTIALRMDLWSRCPPPILELYFDHFIALMSTSKYKRFNISRCFKRASLIRKLTHALKANLFDPSCLPSIIRVLRTVLTQHWSADDSIKPLFAYLISSLCGSPLGSHYMQSTLYSTPPSSQLAAAEALQVVRDVIQSPSHLTKLLSLLPLHRVLIILLSNNGSIYVAEPCLDILLICSRSSGGASFERRFDQEGGFALLARVLAQVWNGSIQKKVLDHVLGSDATSEKLPGASLFPCLIAAIEKLLQAAFTNDDEPPPSATPMSRRLSQASLGGSPTRLSGEQRRPSGDDATNPDQLSQLLKAFSDAFESRQPFRKLLTTKRIEALIPTLAEFISVTSSPQAASSQTSAQREAVQTLVDQFKSVEKLSELASTQLEALAEQLRAAPTPSAPMSASLVRSPSQQSTYSNYMSSSMFMSASPSRFGVGSPSRPGRRPNSSGLERRTSNRTRSFFERIPLKRSLTGESILTEGKDKNEKWKQSIIASEASRFAKTSTEMKEFWKRVALRDWSKVMLVADSEVGLWPEQSDSPIWRLDGSEGPQRKRMKLELVTTNVADRSSAFNPRRHRNPIPRADELSSAVSRVGLSDDPFSQAMSDAVSGKSIPATIQEHSEDQRPAETDAESGDDEILDDRTAEETDRMRRITQTLQPGDTVEDIFNISRVVGVDSAPGLLICGRRHLYMIDGLVQDAKGEIIPSQSADRDLFTIPSGTLAELDTTEQQSHRWPFNEIVEHNKRSFLFRDVALEFFFADKRNFLCVFRTKRERQNLLIKLAAKRDPNAIKQSVIGNFVLDTVARAMEKVGHELENVTSRWQRREISNFAYLQILNQYANRTPNDVTQYPVFPWIIRDWSSTTLDLASPTTFRDLSLPMGALTPARRAAATERYEQSLSTGEKPFQYGTHYSSSMIVCSYNIRVSPFTEMFLSLQGGAFDLADRLFYSLGRAWDSASADNRGDVRELIPEFFYSPLFLRNMNHQEFGRKQTSDEVVDDVDLPPWALGDPLLFIHRHREALESDYVSRHLPAWIDLIFGYKQHDASSFTCYHPLSYKGAIDLDAIDDENEKAASVGIIHNFGQTPYKIFDGPHPQRFLVGRSSLPMDKRFGVDEHWPLLIRSSMAIGESTTAMHDIFPNLTPDLPPQAYPPGRIPFGNLHSSTLRYGFLDQSMRAYYGSIKVACVVDSVEVDQAVFVSNAQFATASSAGIVTIWKTTLPNSTFLTDGSKLSVDAVLRGHRRKVNHMAASDAWSILVSASDDGTAIVWDLNRLRFLRRLVVDPPEPVLRVAIAESEGHLALLCASYLHVYTLNGELVASAPAPASPLRDYSFHDASSEATMTTFCGGISFFNKEFSREGPLFAVGFGNQVVLWRLTPGVVGEPPWHLEELKRMPAPDNAKAVTAVRFIGDALYACFAPNSTKTAKHAMYQWSMPEGGARQLDDSKSEKCMADCGRRFGLLEPRRHCGGCGGLFCTQDCLHIEGLTQRYCPSCRVSLALGMGLMGSRANSRRNSSVPGSRVGSRAGSRAGSRRNSLIAGALA